tara:strand:+ start:526 stop:939 length:414 start_codon:yes stop_codon:yes gene_type:complete
MQELQKQKRAILGYAIDQLDSQVGLDCCIEDLHHHLFNEDYFIIGSYKATKFIGQDLGDILRVCVDFEKDMGIFDESFYMTILEPEKVVNKFSYVIGYEILNNSRIYQLLSSFNSYDYLTKFHLDLIKKELEALYNA